MPEGSGSLVRFQPPYTEQEMKMSLRIVKIDVMDGNPPIVVAIKAEEAERISDFIKSARESINAVAAQEEAEYYSELNRGYAQDRA